MEKDYINKLNNVLNVSRNEFTTRDLILEESEAVTKLLLLKNEAYGDSALNPAGIFAGGDAVPAPTGDDAVPAPTTDTPPVIGQILTDTAEKEAEYLDGLKLDCFPVDELERRKAWMSIPRATRAAIRRMHHMLGHKPNSVPIQLLKGARADKGLIDAVGLFKCDDCTQVSSEKRSHPIAPPTTYAFNHEVLIDIYSRQRVLWATGTASSR